MNRFILIALAFALVFNLVAPQTLGNGNNTLSSTNNTNSTSNNSSNSSNNTSSTNSVNTTSNSNSTSTNSTNTSNNTNGANNTNSTNSSNSTNNTNSGFPSLWIKTCSAVCGSSCSNCPNSTWINNTNTTTPLVLCPQNQTQNASQNGSFCFVDTYLSNGSWTVQNCSSCGNSSNTSCTGCTLINDTFVKDFCVSNGTCWSISYNNSLAVNVSNASNTASALLTETCSSSACGVSCLNCSNSTQIDNITNPQVVCPQNGTFCYVNYYWNNGTGSTQNCTTCANSSNTSCTGCNWVINSIIKSFCAANGTCWSISFNNTNNTMNQPTNLTVTTNSTSVNGTNTTVIGVSDNNCNCNNSNNGTQAMTGVDANGQPCSCSFATGNTTQYPNGTQTANITSKLVNASIIVASGISLQVCLGAILMIFTVVPGWLFL